MKNFILKNKTISFMAICCYLLLQQISCNDLSGHGGVSYDIKESKERGVFICEYYVDKNPYKINDTLQIFIKKVWIENRWKYPKNLNNTLAIDGFQLCIKSDEKSLKGVDFNWTIGINGDHYCRASSNSSLIGDFNTMPGDTIVYLVQEGDDLSDNGDKKIIGKFILIKKE